MNYLVSGRIGVSSVTFLALAFAIQDLVHDCFFSEMLNRLQQDFQVGVSSATAVYIQCEEKLNRPER